MSAAHASASGWSGWKEVVGGDDDVPEQGEGLPSRKKGSFGRHFELERRPTVPRWPREPQWARNRGPGCVLLICLRKVRQTRHRAGARIDASHYADVTRRSLVPLGRGLHGLEVSPTAPASHPSGDVRHSERHRGRRQR